MRRYETPGVYHERADASAGGVSALRMDVAGFVGITQRGPLHLAVPVESYRQFVAWFGEPFGSGYLAYCARGFFENGGRRMWAVRVASDAASAASAVWMDTSMPAPRAAWRIEASGAGVWGNALAVRLTETRRSQCRARIDPVAPSRLHVDSIAGLERGALIEITQNTTNQCAVVRDLDPVGATLTLDRELGGFDEAPLRVETITYSIEVFEAGRLLVLYENVSLVPEHPRYGPALLAMPWQVIDPAMPDRSALRAAENDVAVDYFRVARNRGAVIPPPIVVRELRDGAHRHALNLLDGVAGAAPVAPTSLAGGADGLAALTVRDFVGEEVSPLAGDAAVLDARRGLAALALVDEVGLLAVPDIHIRPEPTPRFDPRPCVPDPCLPGAPPFIAPPPATEGDAPPLFSPDEIYRVQAAMVAQCEKRRDRIALLDAPFDTCNQLTFTAAALRAWRSRFDSPFATLYVPWLRVVDPLRTQPGARPDRLTRAIPPSGHVAGAFAATDLKRGVHVAPANTPLAWLQDVTLAFDSERHGMLNTLGVNVIRAESGRGLRVLGARTLASDTDWRFVNVRRLVSMVRKALDFSLQWAVFEPNDWRLRSKLALVVGLFLRELWARGALVGATPDEAFYVRCDASNNPADARERGELLVEVGLAPSVPFEFIVLRIGRDANGFALAEGATAALAA